MFSNRSLSPVSCRVASQSCSSMSKSSRRPSCSVTPRDSMNVRIAFKSRSRATTVPVERSSSRAHNRLACIVPTMHLANTAHHVGETKLCCFEVLRRARVLVPRVPVLQHVAQRRAGLSSGGHRADADARRAEELEDDRERAVSNVEQSARLRFGVELQVLKRVRDVGHCHGGARRRMHRARSELGRRERTSKCSRQPSYRR